MRPMRSRSSSGFSQSNRGDTAARSLSLRRPLCSLSTKVPSKSSTITALEGLLAEDDVAGVIAKAPDSGSARLITLPCEQRRVSRSGQAKCSSMPGSAANAKSSVGLRPGSAERAAGLPPAYPPLPPCDWCDALSAFIAATIASTAPPPPLPPLPLFPFPFPPLPSLRLLLLLPSLVVSSALLGAFFSSPPSPSSAPSFPD
mmetsp:Transcript_78813/g.142161  ORF Transcript_78813/g.142161 Transcript_78813/m.142161 type:complete len:201 (-) Transcript_78813:1018-1620(-)